VIQVRAPDVVTPPTDVTGDAAADSRVAGDADVTDDSASPDTPGTDLIETDVADASDVPSNDVADAADTASPSDSTDTSPADLDADTAETDVPVALEPIEEPACLGALGIMPAHEPLCAPSSGVVGACLTFDDDVDNGDGTWTVIDGSQWASHGFAADVAYVAGFDETSVAAVELDGSGTAVVIPASEGTRQQIIAVDGWVWLDALPDSGTRVGLADYSGGWGIFVRTDDTPMSYLYASMGGRVDVAAPQLGDWFHVAAINDGTALRVLIDGVEIGRQDGAPPAGTSGSAFLAFGKNHPSGDVLVGRIDDFRVWYELPSDESLCQAAVRWGRR